MDFMDRKWWGLVREARKVHPALTWEVRPNAEWDSRAGVDIRMDQHCNDGGPPRQSFWGRDYGTDPVHSKNFFANLEEARTMKPEEAISTLTDSLKKASCDGTSGIILGQFNLLDNTPAF